MKNLLGSHPNYLVLTRKNSNWFKFHSFNGSISTISIGHFYDHEPNAGVHLTSAINLFKLLET